MVCVFLLGGSGWLGFTGCWVWGTDALLVWRAMMTLWYMWAKVACILVRWPRILVASAFCFLVADLVFFVGTVGWAGRMGGIVKPAALQYSAHVVGRSWTVGQSSGSGGNPGGACRILLESVGVAGVVRWSRKP